MFNIGRMWDWSSHRKNQANVQARLRRITDLTTPNKLATDNPLRFENRNNRTIPVLLCPWNDDGPELDKCTTAITKDISDRGISVVLNHPVSEPNLVIGFYLPDRVMSEPWFFYGKQCRNAHIGGGFWLLAAELFEVLNESREECLQLLLPRAKKLLPKYDAPADAEVGAPG